MKFSQLLLVSTIALLSFTAHSEQENGQTLIFGGKIYSADPSNLHPEAIGIEGKKIIAVGSYQYVADKLNANAKRIDLKGTYIMPGMIDTHAHVAFAGFQDLTVKFPKGMNNAEAIEAFVLKNKDNDKLYLGDILLFNQVSLDYWENISLLDSVFNATKYQNVPVILAGSDAHTGWVNQAMLRKAGISEKSVKEKYSELLPGLGQSSDGKFNGFVSESAWDKVLSAVPPVSDDNIARAITIGAKTLNQFGVTAWMDPISNARPLAPVFNANPDRNDEGLLPAYTTLAKTGKLTGHVTGLSLVNINASPDIIDDVIALQHKFSGLSDIKLAGIKIFQDGVIEYPSQTAKLSQDYLNRPGYSGKDDLNKAQFYELIRKADANHLITHFHAIGDRAVQEALDALDYARKKNGDSKVLHSITHLEVISPKDIQRFHSLNVAASMQLLWAGRNAGTTTLLEGKIPTPLLSHLYPVGSLTRANAIIAGASDWPVSSPNPLLAIYTAITRKGSMGILPPASEQASRETMLQAYTINAAKVVGRAQQIGSISEGKSADLVAFDRNLETVNIEKLKDAKVLWTMFEGNMIYQG